MTKYVLGPKAPGTTWQLVHPEGSAYSGNRIFVHHDYTLGSCAIGGLKYFTYVFQFVSWNDKAEMMACLYRALYMRGHVIYSLDESQLNNALHQALVEIGSRQVDAFPNIYHGPKMMYLFRVNIRNCAGRFCDKMGNAYTDEASVNPAHIITEQTERQGTNYQNMPTSNN
jgi:hypothetical protein